MEQNYALVTGASSGIGEAIAKALAAKGYFVFLVGRDRERLCSVHSAIGGDQHGAFVQADVTDQTQIATIASAVKARTRSLNVLVNAAGAFKWDADFPGETPEAKRENAIAVLHTLNYESKVWLWEALNELLDNVREGAVVVNISSQAANFPDHADPERGQPFGAFTHGEVGYVFSMRNVSAWTRDQQLRIRVSAVEFILIEPTLIDTPGSRREFTPEKLGGFDPWADPKNFQPVSSVVNEVLEKIDKAQEV